MHPAATSLSELIDRMHAMLEPLVAGDDPRAYFLATYLRTTEAVAREVTAGRFVDPEWTERWDVAFAQLYLDAVEQWDATGTAPGPWQIAFGAGDDDDYVPPLRHVLLGMNAHINYDLPRSLLPVISDDEFDDPSMVERRRADHERIDEILASRVRAEDRELKLVERPGDRTVVDRLLTPFNRRATRRFLKEARTKVWHNTLLLSRARREGRLDQRVAELAELSRERVADLQAPGLVVLRLARHGFGVVLSDDGVAPPTG